MGVDGLQSGDHPVHIGQGRARAVAGEDSMVALSHCQVGMAHADLGKVWEEGQGGRIDKEELVTKLCPRGQWWHFLPCLIMTPTQPA